MCRNPKNAYSMTTIDVSQLAVLQNIKGVYVNTTQEVLIVNKEKVELCLMQHLKQVEKRRDWIAPLGILISLLLTIASSSFKDEALGLPGDTWSAFFLFAAVGVFAWLVMAAYTAIKAGSVPDILDRLTKEAQTMPVEPQASTDTEAAIISTDVQGGDHGN